MQHEIQWSLIDHLKKRTGLPVIWIYDGVTLPGEEGKPYITVEQMQNANVNISKMREAISVTHRFQVGLFAKTGSDRARKQDIVKRVMMFDDIPLWDTSKDVPDVIGKFNAVITSETPISPENIADKSKYHRIYFDVEVLAVMHRKTN